MGKFLFGLIVGLVVIPVGVYMYFSSGSAPVATSSAPCRLKKCWRAWLCMRGCGKRCRSPSQSPPMNPHMWRARRSTKTTARFVMACRTIPNGHRPRNVSETAEVSGGQGSHRRCSGRNLLESGRRDSHDGDAGFRQDSLHHADVAGEPVAGECRQTAQGRERRSDRGTCDGDARLEEVMRLVPSTLVREGEVHLDLSFDFDTPTIQQVPPVPPLFDSFDGGRR